MAEFITMMNEYKRLCDTYTGCCGCPFDGLNLCEKLTVMSNDNLNKFEQIVMKWSKEHPEPKYPTWEEWLGKEFGVSVIDMICKFYPCIFTGEIKQCGDCTDCRKRAIPKEVAEKLGIKPIAESKGRK